MLAGATVRVTDVFLIVFEQLSFMAHKLSELQTQLVSC